MNTPLGGSKTSLYKNWMAQLVFAVFLVVTIWWVWVKPFNSEVFVNAKNYWSASYEVISLLGGIFGIIISNRWGGYKSFLGRAILAFSVGLLLQTFGQVVYNYYTLVKQIAAPYPSLGDVGYFGSIPAYVYGSILLGRVSGFKVSFKSFHNQMLAILFPLLMVTGSYLTFLKAYQFDWSSPIKVFLDFGYPLGQAVYVSIALLALFMSRKFLGGIMRKPLVLLLVALVVQYICDTDFLYKANNGIWYPGGPGDFLYAVSYLIMTFGLIYIGLTFYRIRES